MDYYSANKTNRYEAFVTAWLYLEGIILVVKDGEGGGRNQRRENKKKIKIYRW